MNFLMRKNGNTPIYLQIKEQLKDYIANNKLQEGDRLPNIQNIADAAGVTITGFHHEIKKSSFENGSSEKKFQLFFRNDAKTGSKTREQSSIRGDRSKTNLKNRKTLHTISIGEIR